VVKTIHQSPEMPSPEMSSPDVPIVEMSKSKNSRFMGVVRSSGDRWQLIKRFHGIGFQGFSSEPQAIVASHEIAK